FYAAVNFAPSNTFWNDFGTLNTYIARSQSFLQAGKPDNDILLYYPISDEYAVRGRSLLLHFDGAAKGSSVRETAEYLFGKGFAFDYISDRQVQGLESQAGKIQTGGTAYQTILIPEVKLMPLETFEKVIGLAKNGATILMEQVPEDVPGLGNLSERQAKLQELKKSLKFDQTIGVVKKAKVGKGQILMGSLADLLDAGKIRREAMYDKGLQCIRRNDAKTTTYFIANRGTETIDGMTELQAKIGSAVLFNPMTGAFGKAKTSTANEIYLQLKPGESCLVQVYPDQVNTPEYIYLTASGEKINLNSEWMLSFLTGGPTLPEPVKLSKLGTWTELTGSSYQAFSGTAMYKTTFIKPSGNPAFYTLDLGKVAHSARIILNGKELTTVISAPFSVVIPSGDLTTENTLEIAVTNLMGNRMADMERKGEPYKIFYNTNFPAHDAVNRGADGLFTTLGWKPQESGLIGPVTLTPLQLMK
ncbi:MAG: glycosylhydrolase-like jelly roll fold domain-containing protein, partial [Prolixibacteraceae bacterium]